MFRFRTSYLPIARCLPLICLARVILAPLRANNFDATRVSAEGGYPSIRAVEYSVPCHDIVGMLPSGPPVPPVMPCPVLFQAHQHGRTLSAFEEMQAAGVTADRETFSAAAEACACISSDDGASSGGGGGMGARAMELLRMARDQGLRRPPAKAVAATLAACVGGGPWRRAIPAVEAMLVASGRHAWDDVMGFLAEAQLGRRDRGGQILGAELDADGGGGGGGGAVVAADVAASTGGPNTEEEPRFDGHNNGSGACVTGSALDTTRSAPPPTAAPLQAAKCPGSKHEATTRVRLQTRPIPEAVNGPTEEADEERGREDGERRRARHPRPQPKATARGAAAAAAAAAAASLKLSGVSALAAAAADQAS